eukprot:297846-Chlamydomonas_euryale.AAC.2
MPPSSAAAADVLGRPPLPLRSSPGRCDAAAPATHWRRAMRGSSMLAKPSRDATLATCRHAAAAAAAGAGASATTAAAPGALADVVAARITLRRRRSLGRRRSPTSLVQRRLLAPRRL